MSAPKAGLKAVWRPIATIIVIAAAAVVWHNLPTPTDVYGPFEVRGRAGEPVEGRAITATVTSVHVAPNVNSVEAAGTWVVVDTTLEANRATELVRADLVVGPNTYAPSDRFFFDTLDNEISPGMAEIGSLVFDVAPALVASEADEPLLVRVWAGNEVLDSRLVIEIPLADPAITRTDEVQLIEREVTAS